MSKPVVPYADSELSKKEQVTDMFDKIAPQYDFLNHFLSLGVDLIWRKKAVKTLKGRGVKKLLDVATGTGDLAVAASKIDVDEIIGLDISKGMLKLAEKKIVRKGLSDKISFELGDSENLRFDDHTFDAATVAFGVRNFGDLEKGMSEIHRVLNTNGKFVVLEFSKPRVFPIKQIYHFYFKYLLPIMGKLFSQDPAAYEYLPESVQAFPEREEFISVLNKIGFKETTFKPLTFGICALYTGIK